MGIPGRFQGQGYIGNISTCQKQVLKYREVGVGKQGENRG